MQRGRTQVEEGLRAGHRVEGDAGDRAEDPTGPGRPGAEVVVLGEVKVHAVGPDRDQLGPPRGLDRAQARHSYNPSVATAVAALVDSRRSTRGEAGTTAVW